MLSGSWKLPYRDNEKTGLFLNLIKGASELTLALPEDVLNIIALLYAQLQQTSLKKIFDEIASKKPAPSKNKHRQPKQSNHSLFFKARLNNNQAEIQQHIRALFTTYEVTSYETAYDPNQSTIRTRYFSKQHNEIDSNGYVVSNEGGFIIARFPYGKNSDKSKKILSEFQQIFSGSGDEKYCVSHEESMLYVGFSKGDLNKIINRGKQLQKEQEESSYRKKFGYNRKP